MRAAILVLGDLGRSPRMQHHALAIAAAGVDVDLIGLAGTDVWPAVRRNARITCHLIDRADAPLKKAPGAFFRALWNGARALAMLLFRIPAPDVILIQNPPAIPAMLAGWIAAKVRSARLVIDWHNFGYSMLALRFPGRRRLIATSKWLEAVLGRKADGHLCVSNAMRSVLKAQWRIEAVTLYDRPVQELFAMPPNSAQNARRRLAVTLGVPVSAETLVVMSPTSWSLDEDFDVLLDAVPLLEQGIKRGEQEGHRYRPLLFLLTGLGPRRQLYEARLSALSSDRIRLLTAWLDADDYHWMLRAADLGLCLHRSASGLDLPMKIADMSGAGLPMLVLDYGPVLREILLEGGNSQLFSNGADLARLLVDFSAATNNVSTRIAAPTSWESEWNAHARSVVLP